MSFYKQLASASVLVGVITAIVIAVSVNHEELNRALKPGSTSPAVVKSCKFIDDLESKVVHKDKRLCVELSSPDNDLHARECVVKFVGWGADGVQRQAERKWLAWNPGERKVAELWNSDIRFDRIDVTVEVTEFPRQLRRGEYQITPLYYPGGEMAMESTEAAPVVGWAAMLPWNW